MNIPQKHVTFVITSDYAKIGGTFKMYNKRIEVFIEKIQRLEVEQVIL